MQVQRLCLDFTRFQGPPWSTAIRIGDVDPQTLLVTEVAKTTGLHRSKLRWGLSLTVTVPVAQ